MVGAMAVVQSGVYALQPTNPVPGVTARILDKELTSPLIWILIVVRR